MEVTAGRRVGPSAHQSLLPRSSWVRPGPVWSAETPTHTGARWQSFPRPHCLHTRLAPPPCPPPLHLPHHTPHPMAPPLPPGLAAPLQTFIKDEVERYQPSPQDLDYPAKLEREELMAAGQQDQQQQHGAGAGSSGGAGDGTDRDGLDGSNGAAGGEAGSAGPSSAITLKVGEGRRWHPPGAGCACCQGGCLHSAGWPSHTIMLLSWPPLLPLPHSCSQGCTFQGASACG